MTRRRGGRAADAASAEAEVEGGVGASSERTPEGPLRIVYVRVRDAVLWDRNPKRHDMGGIVQSIREHGFRDAPIYDSALGAIVAGNGRTTALSEIREQGPMPEADKTGFPPVGVVEDQSGDWWMPLQVGVDAPTREKAEAFGVDHNLLTATGGDLGLVELAGLFDHDRLLEVLQTAQGAGVPVFALSADDLQALLNPAPPAAGKEYGPDAASDVKMLTCPSCGHQFPR